MARPRATKHSETAQDSKVAAGGVNPVGIEPTAMTNKAQAVREALAKGIEAPGDIADFALSTYGLDIPKQQIGSYKSQAKSKGAVTGAKRGRKPKAAAVEGYLAPPKIEAKGDGDLLDALEALKPLIASLGADKVRRLVDVLA